MGRPTRVGVAGRRDYPAPARREVNATPPAKPTKVVGSEMTEATVDTAGTSTDTAAERGVAEAGKNAPGERASFGPAAGEPAKAGPRRAAIAKTGASETVKTGSGTRRAATSGSGKSEPQQRTGGSADHQNPTAAKAERHIAEQRVDDDRSTPSADGKPTETATRVAKPKPAEAEGRPVPGARMSNFAEEAAELLAGLSANRKRRKSTAGLPAGDPVDEPPITVTRLPRRGRPKPAED
jgi:hypothetical protein